jgi:predicted esterase
MFNFCSMNFKKNLYTSFTLALLLICNLLALSILSGCASHTSLSNEKNPRILADQLAQKAGFNKNLITTSSFTFTTYQKFTSTDAKFSALTVYIEGDGRSWITRNKLSPDPTPLNPLALKLAILDPSPNVVYLARPCQYTPLHLNRVCSPEIWSDARFSETVISNMNHAIEKIKRETNAKQIHLVGFSGGAAIAVLVAARRHDIASLRTIAGDLDHVALSQYHKTTPLFNSLNPAAAAYQLVGMPQIHFAGEKDKVVPPFISAGFVSEITRQGGRCAKQFILKDATHHKEWEKAWPKLVTMPMG